MAANGISTLMIPSGLTATSFTGSYPVASGTFNYDSYGAGFSIRKDGGPIDTYINYVLAMPALSAREYVFDQITDELKPFTYGQALISFTLNANGTFSNVVCTFGAGGYSASSGQLTMLGTKFVGGVSPANDIVWDYVCAGNDGVITSFSYASGTPPIGRVWTFVPANGQPSFTRAMQAPTTNVELPAETVPTWNIATAGGVNLGGNGINELNPTTTPVGTLFNIYVTELGTGGQADKERRQKSKLDLAATDRAADGNPRATYDITLLPTQYNGNVIIDNPNAGGLVVGRPWIETVSTFTFYEAFGANVAISTTQFVSGSKIYAESSTYNVPNYQNARIVVNDIQVANTALRGHTLVVLDSYGDVVAGPTQYDTYIDSANVTALASALTSVTSNNIAVLVVYDASAVSAAVRTAINTGYGSTNSNTWTANRLSQIFIGIKV